MSGLITLEEIEAARAGLPPAIRRTPTLPLARGPEEVGTEGLFLKLENFQITGAYKPRAAFHILGTFSAEERRMGVVIPSSGNFAQGFAIAGRMMGVRVAVVMPEMTIPYKVEATRAYGADVVFSGNDYAKRQPMVEETARARGMISINIQTDRRVPIGHSSIGLEIIEDLSGVETVVVPISSGGLIAGVASAIKLKAPEVRVIGAQPAGAAAMHRSLRAGAPTPIEKWETMADALSATQVSQFLFDHACERVDEVVLVTEEEITGAFRLLLHRAKVLAEPGGAVAAAACLSGKVRGAGKIVALVSGGNMTADLAAQLAAG